MNRPTLSATCIAVVLGLGGCKDLELHANKKTIRFGETARAWVTYKGKPVPIQVKATWRSSRDGEIARGGRTFLPRTLSAGTHQITVHGKYRGKEIKVGPMKLEVENDPPRPRILAPRVNETSYGRGARVVLDGSATDREDGHLAGVRLWWTAQRIGSDWPRWKLVPRTRKTVGNGGRVTFAPGQHYPEAPYGRFRIVLHATDAAGVTGRTWIDVFVRPEAGETQVPANRMPELWLTNPRDPRHQKNDVQLAVATFDRDRQRPVPDRLISWSSSQSGHLGHGARLKARLPDGRHLITVRVQDPDDPTRDTDHQFFVHVNARWIKRRRRGRGLSSSEVTAAAIILRALLR